MTMKWFAETLWDMLGARPARPAGIVAAPVRRFPTMQERYDRVVEEMKRAHGVRVRRWRGETSGCAWEVRDRQGRVTRLIEAPYPRGPVSCAVFLHEIGHHAIGFGTFRPRCLEEYHAWRWAIETMRAKGLNVTSAVEKRMDEALCYALGKARRRGLRAVPAELIPYLGAR
jgi:hypothetical protein